VSQICLLPQRFSDHILDPLAETAYTLQLLNGIGSSPVSNARLYAFCFCVRALSFELPPSGAADNFYSSIGSKYPVINCVTDWSCRALDASVLKLSTMGPLWNEDRSLSSVEWPVERDQMHAIALKALGLLSVEVKSAAARQALVLPTLEIPEQNNRKKSSKFAIPRSGHDIPFGSFMELPTPCSADALADFNVCHLPAMATKSLVEEGGWSGVEFGSRTSPFQSTQVTCIAPFKLLVTFDDASSDVMTMESSSLLNAGAQFCISLKKSSGIALVTFQQDAFAEPLHWQGILTPFGIVGTTTLSPGDWFWLWKTSWAGEYQQKYDWTKLWGRGSVDLVYRAVAKVL
jgi:hypothetical protein